MKIVQHVPGFVSGHTPFQFEFNTTQELLNRPEIIKIQDTGSIWMKSKDEDEIMLMIEYNNSRAGQAEDEGERTFYVIGYISGTKEELETIDLPEFDYNNPKYHNKQNKEDK